MLAASPDLRRCLRRRWCSGHRRVRPPARSPHASLKARSGRSRSPPVPSGPSGALHTGGAWSLMRGSARRLEAQPGPAAAHGHRSQALLRPPDPPAPSTPVVRLECVVKLVACGSAGVPGTVGSGRPRDRHTRASLGVVDLEARPCPPDPPAPSTPAARLECAVKLVACGSAGVPGAVGSGRPRDRHTRACGSEWSISKPARALRTLRHPPHQWRGWNAWLSLSPVGIALRGEPLHRFVASAMLRYLVHCLPK